MAEKPRDYEAELRAIMDALAESVAEAPDSDLLAEAREAGEDTARTAERVRAVLKRAAKDHDQRLLREAKQAYEESVESIRTRPYMLPKTPESRRNLFGVVISRKPQLGQALVTAQHREFKDLTDADIQSFLEQLAALGVLDEFERPPDAEA
jgi:cell division septum initiation protein DivIVA